MLRAGLIFAFLMMFATAAVAADWHYFGDAGSKVEMSMFYDADSIQRPTPETVRVWVEGIPAKRLSYYEAKKSEKRITEELLHKMKVGYIPGFLLLPDIGERYSSKGHALADAAINFTMIELLADSDNVQRLVSEYWEIDCRRKRVRFLSFIKYNRKGKIEKVQNFSVPPYTYFPPESTGQWLSEMVCPKH